MHAIFQAIRRAKDLRGTDIGAPLRHFEGVNRGHQDILDALNGPIPQDSGKAEAFAARKANALHSISDLLLGLRGLSPKDLAGPEWAAILDAEDGTGCLESQALHLLRRQLRWRLWSDIHVDAPEPPRLAGEALRFALTFSKRTSPTAGNIELQASRELTLTAARLNTLRGARALLVQAEAKLAMLLGTAGAWPEFSTETARQRHEQELLRRFDKALSMFSSADREILRKLRPAI